MTLSQNFFFQIHFVTSYCINVSVLDPEFNLIRFPWIAGGEDWS